MIVRNREITERTTKLSDALASAISDAALGLPTTVEPETTQEAALPISAYLRVMTAGWLPHEITTSDGGCPTDAPPDHVHAERVGQAVRLRLITGDRWVDIWTPIGGSV